MCGNLLTCNVSTRRRLAFAKRGLCTALVLSGFGLSAFFYSSLSHTLFPGKTGDYLLLLALGSSLSFLFGFSLIKILPQDGPSLSSDSRRPSFARTTAEEAEEQRPIYTRRRTSSDIGGRAWAYTVRPDSETDATPSESEAEEDHVLSRGDVQAEERQGLLHGNGTRREQEAREPEPQRADKKRRDKGVDLVGWSLVKEPDFVLLFLIMTMISGTGLLVINVSGRRG